jgi:hypothetical protein
LILRILIEKVFGVTIRFENYYMKNVTLPAAGVHAVDLRIAGFV